MSFPLYRRHNEFIKYQRYSRDNQRFERHLSLRITVGETMKLDWNLMRTILAHVESETIQEFVDDANSLAQWKEGQLLSERRAAHIDPATRVVFEHVELLQSGGFLDGIYVSESVDGFFQISFSANPSLTLAGYSLLENLRAAEKLARLENRAFNPRAANSKVREAFEAIAVLKKLIGVTR